MLPTRLKQRSVEAMKRGLTGGGARNKGKRGEREVIVLLQPIVRQVYEAAGRDVPTLQRNTLQAHKGGYDIVGLPWLALEVKREQQLAVHKWWQQTLRQCGQHQVPALLYRRNCSEWKAVVQVQVVTSSEVLTMAATINLHDFLRYFRARLVEELDHVA